MKTTISHKKIFRDPETAAFCGQMHLVLQAGISSLEGLEIMKENSNNPSELAILDQMIQAMQESGSLYTACCQTGLFPSYMLHMTQIGEESGTLDEVMGALESYYQRQIAISQAVRSALTFPMIMIGMMIVVIVVLLTVVLPIFHRVFLQLGSEMTGISSVLLSIGNALNRYSIVFIIIAAILVLLIILGLTTKKGKQIFIQIGSIFPGIRRIREQIARSHFANALFLMLKSGLNPERSMELLLQLNESAEFQDRLEKMTAALKEGEDFSKALADSSIFTGMSSRLILIGEKAGSMEDAMRSVADSCQEEVDNRISHTLSVLEPALVVILSVIVGIILLSVMLPLLGIISGI